MFFFRGQLSKKTVIFVIYGFSKKVSIPKNLPQIIQKANSNNINNLDSDQYPKYMRVFDEEVGNINSIHFFNNGFTLS